MTTVPDPCDTVTSPTTSVGTAPVRIGDVAPIVSEPLTLTERMALQRVAARHLQPQRVGSKTVSVNAQWSVLAAFLAYTGADGSCYPELATIAEAAGMNERTARTAADALVADGWLVRGPRRRTGGRLRGYAWWRVSVPRARAALAASPGPRRLPAGGDVTPLAGTRPGRPAGTRPGPEGVTPEGENHHPARTREAPTDAVAARRRRGGGGAPDGKETPNPHEHDDHKTAPSGSSAEGSAAARADDEPAWRDGTDAAAAAALAPTRIAAARALLRPLNLGSNPLVRRLVADLLDRHSPDTIRAAYRGATAVGTVVKQLRALAADAAEDAAERDRDVIDAYCLGWRDREVEGYPDEPTIPGELARLPRGTARRRAYIAGRFGRDLPAGLVSSPVPRDAAGNVVTSHVEHFRVRLTLAEATADEP